MQSVKALRRWLVIVALLRFLAGRFAHIWQIATSAAVCETVCAVIYRVPTEMLLCSFSGLFSSDQGAGECI